MAQYPDWSAAERDGAATAIAALDSDGRYWLMHTLYSAREDAQRATEDAVALRFNVRHAITRAMIRDANDKPVQIVAYTAKAARHRAKVFTSAPIIIEPVGS